MNVESSSTIANFFRPVAAAVPQTDAQEIRDQYRSWQRRVLVSSIIGTEERRFVPGASELRKLNVEADQKHQQQLAHVGKPDEDRPVWFQDAQHLRAKDNSSEDETDRSRQPEALHQPRQCQHEEQAKREAREMRKMLGKVHANRPS